MTGNRARYIDPLTKLPYADANAFRTIREKYMEYIANNGYANKISTEGHSSSDGFARQPTPAKLRKLASSEAGTSNGKIQIQSGSQSKDHRLKMENRQ